MCTLTIIRWNANAKNDASLEAGDAGGVRVACNRDESRLRPAALPPELRQFGNHSAFMPVDPVSDGTWIAASDAGLVLVLMNVNVMPRDNAAPSIGPPRARPPISRGRVIPRVLEASNLRDAVKLVEEVDLISFDPFRLVIVDRSHFAEFTWSGERESTAGPAAIDRPIFFTSSGLGDAVVASPRRRLFAEQFSQPHDWPTDQDAFHRHFWPDNQRASVWMTRRDALTVSRTEVELNSNRVTMSYHARIGDSLNLVDYDPVSLPMVEP